MWPYPKVAAHRGGGILAPENTLAALQCGLDYGFRAVEFDVMLSKDGIPVLMHDPDFGRTVAGHGNVAETLADDLFKLDAGAWLDQRFAGATVPSYQAAVRFCREHGIWMNVEIKPVPGYEAQTATVVAELTRQWYADLPAGAPPRALPLFSSFSYEAMLCAQAAAPDIPRAWLADSIPPDWQEKLERLKAVALHTNHKYLKPDLAQAVKRAGYGLFCYTVNTPERAREILNWGVDGFCTDRIDLIPADFA